MAVDSAKMERIVALCKRRGFVFQSSEIYGGIGGFWDYGPLGTELKRNIKDAWWHDMVHHPPVGPDGQTIQMVGVDCSIIMNPRVWEASGHVGGFSDPMVDCKDCRLRFRADKVFRVGWYNRANHAAWLVAIGAADGIDPIGAAALGDLAAVPAPDQLISVEADTDEAAGQSVAVADLPRKMRQALGDDPVRVAVSLDMAPGAWPAAATCPGCRKGELTEPREFNLMFQTYVGALQDSTSVAYLRPETAQGIFANFKNVMDSTRVKIPFGIAQIGKAFRNEINPRNFTFRSREFEQMEIEFFCHPDESMKWYTYWRDARLRWYESLGIRSENLRPREQTPDERAHYSQACIDIEYLFPFSEEPQELEGVAHRGCYDLSAHGRHAKGKDEAFAVVDDQTKQRFVPHVIEPSAGADRFTLAAICEAYTEDPDRASPEFMRFNPRLAPIKAAVFPLVAKDGMPDLADPIFQDLRRSYPVQFDAKQSIGKRYARMDEAGTPFCFTVDGQTKEDGTVTVRNRDDASQVRIDKSRCREYLADQLQLT